LRIEIISECVLCNGYFCNFLQDCEGPKDNKLDQISNYDFKTVPNEAFRGNATEKKILNEIMLKNRTTAKALFKNIMKDELHMMDFTDLRKRIKRNIKEEAKEEEDDHIPVKKGKKANAGGKPAKRPEVFRRYAVDPMDSDDEEEGKGDELSLTRIDSACLKCMDLIYSELLYPYLVRMLHHAPRQYTERPKCPKGFECNEQNNKGHTMAYNHLHAPGDDSGKAPAVAKKKEPAKKG
jgi:hypothetical protein